MAVDGAPKWSASDTTRMSPEESPPVVSDSRSPSRRCPLRRSVRSHRQPPPVRHRGRAPPRSRTRMLWRPQQPADRDHGERTVARRARCQLVAACATTFASSGVGRAISFLMAPCGHPPPDTDRANAEVDGVAHRRGDVVVPPDPVRCHRQQDDDGKADSQSRGETGEGIASELLDLGALHRSGPVDDEAAFDHGCARARLGLDGAVQRGVLVGEACPPCQQRCDRRVGAGDRTCFRWSSC